MVKRFNIFFLFYITTFIPSFSQNYEQYYKNWQKLYNIDFFFNPENKVENPYKYGWGQHPSGLRYIILKEGLGYSPSLNDIVEVHYTGILSNGKIFDSSIEKGKSLTFPLNSIIPGLKESIKLLKPNGIGVFLIPSELAYGSTGLKGTVPPNTSLIFWIHLIDYERQEDQKSDLDIIPHSLLAISSTSAIEKQQKVKTTEKKEINKSIYVTSSNNKSSSKENVYFIIGTNKDLKEKGVLDKKFLSPSNPKVSDVDLTIFTQAQKSSLLSIPVNSTNFKIWSNMPAESYTINNNEGENAVLKILNPEKFWEFTPYLIIQINNDSAPSYSREEEIYVAVEQPAEYPGGQAALMKWLSQNIRYPESAQQNAIQGRVIVKFVVEKDGSITNAEIARGVDKDLDREALRLVSSMPKWKPGKNNGESVRSYFNLPVTFRLTEPTN